MATDKKTSEETPGSGAQLTDLVRAARGAGNVKLTVSEILALGLVPIEIDFANVASETTAGNLIADRTYKITNCPAYVNGQTYFHSYYDDGASKAAMSGFGFSLLGGTAVKQLWVDWYNGGTNILKMYDLVTGNDIEGATNIAGFPWTNGNVTGNRVGAEFSLDLSALGAGKKFKNNVCFGNGTYAVNAIRDYENIDFTKGCLSYRALISQGAGDPESNPVPIVLKNELGEVPTHVRVVDTPGNYRMDIVTNQFDSAKTRVHIGSLLPTVGAASIEVTSATRLSYYSYNYTFLSYEDNLLNGIILEVDVFF